MCKKKIISLIVLFNMVLLTGCDGKEPNKNEIEPQPEKSDTMGFSASYAHLDNDATLQSKLFYFLLALEHTDAKQEIIGNASLKAVKEKYDRIFDGFSWTKYEDLSAFGKALLLSDDEVLAVQQTLENMSESMAFRSMIEKHIRPSGKYEHYSDLNYRLLTRTVWRASIAQGINTILRQYLVGEAPPYPMSDGLKYSLSSETYKQLIEKQVEAVKTASDTGIFYARLLNFVIGLLTINDRDEAIRFEPLATGENQKAITHLGNIAWDDYSYSSILLLGDSPNSPGDDVHLSQSAKTRIQYAVEAFNARLAPIIIISGANIYPYQTPYFEAIEMKKWMMQQYRVDEKYIIVEPVARHTTTNLRNAARLMFRYGIPNDKKGIIVTTKQQNDVIVTENFKQRCVNSLGYMPVALGKRLSDTRLEFTPLIVSMHINTADPLDP